VHVVYDYQIFGAQLFGGISRYFCALARELDALLDVPPRIIAPIYRNVLLQSAPARLVTGMHVPPLRRTERAARFVNRALFPLLAQRRHPDILHETYYSVRSSYPFDAARVLTVFDMIHERFVDDEAADDGTAEAKAAAVRRADRVICISNQTREDLLARHDLPADRVRVVHLGFDRLDARGATAVELVGERPYLLYVGARTGYKNFARFVEAYAGSPTLRANARIVCFGGGAISRREKELLASFSVAGDVVATSGGDSELAALYAGALVFVYPSL
jgi:glycosyltransferase involved in cell wall biosynthesis